MSLLIDKQHLYNFSKDLFHFRLSFLRTKFVVQIVLMYYLYNMQVEQYTKGFTHTPKFGVTPKGGGFTLIELLVVISIIGMLSSIVLASLNSARQKARDAQRKSALRQMANANELYYDDGNGVYSGTAGWLTNWIPNSNLLAPTYNQLL